MSLDLDAIKGRIANGIYGDDRLTAAEILDALAAMDELVEEVERLRGERAAVVAALRRTSNHGPMGLSLVNLDSIADAIERGEHRREEEP
jgi:hypothetical protein